MNDAFRASLSVFSVNPQRGVEPRPLHHVVSPFLPNSYVVQQQRPQYTMMEPTVRKFFKKKVIKIKDFNFKPLFSS